MNQNVKPTAPPTWFSLASGTIKAMQHRKAPRNLDYGIGDDDPLGELLSAPNHDAPMVDLAEEWIAQNGTDGDAFCTKRHDRIGTTFELISMLRLAATFQSHDAAYALCDPAAITVLEVGHHD